MEPNLVDVLLRITLAFVLSLSFGLERQITKKPVGFGVFTLVATGSCLLSIIALVFSGGSSPLPLLGGIITGIGFLGAGAIIRYQEKAFGFTSAACIWSFAALGVSIGVGFFEAALLFYLFVIVVILLDRFLERKSLGNYSKTVTLVFDSIDGLKAVKERFLIDYREVSIDYNMDGKEFTFTFMFTGHRRRLDELVNKLAGMEGIKNLRVG
ncbi:MAG: MgtC/SapB family protein [Candidatus Altiarchaeota archaeon]|nr:MgtC/SapB family protein [Candidatus Altiarchaeota archaeon]